ncbi:AAA family ATPase [Streptococcus infantarius]|uniref:AAA family ATPase n=1 Tax=Streptococcus infantarius TaxID=102684 RepID=UPI003C181974
MIEDIASIKIKGGIFETETDLPIFEKEKTQKPNFSLIYGKNGSGKSTISRGFRKLTGDEELQIESMELLDADGSTIEVCEEEKNNTYVFNEEFIEDNIKIEDDGLSAIVVMGAVKDVDDNIKQIQPTYEKSLSEAQAQKEVFNKYSDSDNNLCPEYYINKMQEALKGDNSWASRDAKIRNNKTNSKVRRNTYTQFVELHPTKSRDELVLVYDATMKKLEAAKSGSKRIETVVPTLETFEDTENDIVNLLKEKIEKPVLSEREKSLFHILQDDNGNQKLTNIKNHFTGPQKISCPFCFQDVDEKYADDLVQSIEKILSKKVEEHQGKLLKARLSIFEVNLVAFNELSPEKVKECETKIGVLNSSIEQVNELINQKIENVYKPILNEGFCLKNKYDECVASLEELEEARKSFNEKTTATKPLIKELTNVNNEIAYYDLKELYEKYQKQIAEKKTEEEKSNKLNQTANDLRKKIEVLEQEKKNARIAMKAINDDLAYVFFSKTRLRIDYDHDKYVLYSHERLVEPGNVSVGERNAIGLCYFFNRIMENKDEEKVFNSKYLLVIDDPVSSFDMENRIGILSYLKYKLGQYLKGNDKSKFLLFTHDMQTFYDMRHFVLELLSSKYKNGASKYVRDWELKNKSVDKIDIQKRNEYTALLGTVFDYADAEEIDTQYSVSIGNVMRKVMEAFGTFVYKKGMAQLSTDESIMANLSKEDQAYYENLMYRLVLNTGSHMEEKVKTIDDMNFFDYISDADKRRTARDVICFLYKINPLHVKAHLQGKENAVEKIEMWCEAISA